MSRRSSAVVPSQNLPSITRSTLQPMISQSLMLFGAVVSTTAISITKPSNPPPRYHNSLAGATFLSSTENGGTATPPSEYQEVFIQAIDGHLIFTREKPTRICPCADDSFGAKNFTGYYIGGSNESPTLQLFTSSPGAQYVYISPHDLSLRYTLPGCPPPPHANTTSIYFYDPDSGGLPSTSIAAVQGSITYTNGTRVNYNGLEFCAPVDSPPRTEDGIGPLRIFATKIDKAGKAVIGNRCIEGYISNSIDDPQVAPYDVVFRTPAKPLVFAYKN